MVNEDFLPKLVNYVYNIIINIFFLAEAGTYRIVNNILCMILDIYSQITRAINYSAWMNEI